MPKNNRHGQSTILSDGEYAKIRKQLKSESHRLFFDIARWTGERWGAITQLQIEDVYADPAIREPHHYITFRASTRKAAPDGSRTTRQVPIHPQLKESLLLYRSPFNESIWLFPSNEADRPITFSAADKWLRAAVDAAGLSKRGISTHSTRRTFITRLSGLGTDIKIIQALTGHKDVKALIRYIEVSDNQISNALAAL